MNTTPCIPVDGPEREKGGSFAITKNIQGARQRRPKTDVNSSCAGHGLACRTKGVAVAFLALLLLNSNEAAGKVERNSAELTKWLQETYHWGGEHGRENRTLPPSAKDAVPEINGHTIGLWYKCDGECRKADVDCSKEGAAYTVLGREYFIACVERSFQCTLDFAECSEVGRRDSGRRLQTYDKLWFDTTMANNDVDNGAQMHTTKYPAIPSSWRDPPWSELSSTGATAVSTPSSSFLGGIDHTCLPNAGEECDFIFDWYVVPGTYGLDSVNGRMSADGPSTSHAVSWVYRGDIDETMHWTSQTRCTAGAHTTGITVGVVVSGAESYTTTPCSRAVGFCTGVQSTGGGSSRDYVTCSITGGLWSESGIHISFTTDFCTGCA